jgi:hypothetical protein
MAAVASGAVLIPMSAAQASVAPPPTLNGDWAPFNRCPVDNPAMLQADGTTTSAYCVASSSPTATLTIGKIAPTTSSSDLQFGLSLTSATGVFTVIAPQQGSVVSPPVTEPGGLTGLLCPSTTQPLKALCKVWARHPNQNKVTASLLSAGTPSNFNLGAGLSSGIPIVTLPVKIHLTNPHLGPDCYIGTNADPIVLNPENATQPNIQVASFDGNGTPDPSGPMDMLYSTGGTQQDTTFTVPVATGCGDAGMFDAAINQNAGLPSPAGANSLVLTDASAYLAFTSAPNEGTNLSQYWHSAIVGG